MQQAYLKKGFRVINVMNDPPEVVAKLTRENPGLVFVADPRKAIRDQFGVPRVPSSFLVDRDGEVASITVQFSGNSLNQMSAQVATLVKLPAAAIAPTTLAPRQG